jgi:hypothetical protein
MSDITSSSGLNVKQARNLAHTTKSVPQMDSATPRWFLQMLPWINLSGGAYRINHRKTVIRAGAKIPITVHNGVAKIDGPRLKGISLFQDLDDALLDRIAAKFKSETVAMGAMVLKKGDPGDKFLLLAEGKVLV